MNQKIDKEKPVLVAGDPERASMKKCDDKNGISYHINQIKYAVNSFLFFVCKSYDLISSL